MIELVGVSKSFGNQHVLSDVSFTIRPGEFVCITGPSGAGKSTLIHLLTGAERATSGEVKVDGVDLRSVPFPVMQIFRRRIGVVFQDYKLLQDRTVSENIAFPLQVCGMNEEVIIQRVDVLLEQLRLQERADALPRELSGGEKARVAIARAIVHHPMIVMADEPTGNIDPQQSDTILKILREINATGTTVIIATHDTVMVDMLQTRVIRIENGRLVRDSRGGYETAPSQPNKDHNVFEGLEDKVKKDDDEGKRKVKITSIGG